jgi:hypothetical protein
LSRAACLAAQRGDRHACPDDDTSAYCYAACVDRDSHDDRHTATYTSSEPDCGSDGDGRPGGGNVYEGADRHGRADRNKRAD